MRAAVRLFVFAIIAHVLALDNGFNVPPMGWSSWYGFTSNINDNMIREMADGIVSSGLRDAGYKHIWIDDGWALPRDTTGKVTVDPQLFPSGMRNLSDYLHSQHLKFGIYTSKGPLTCLGYQPTQPDRPGSCGYEQVDADTYAHDWQVDQVKDDGCGACPQHNPFTAMREALNRTGRPILFAIHSDGKPWEDASDSNGTVANMWRTGNDLYASSYEMWLDRLDLATDERMRPFVGPGSFANPDFLEVGYSPRAPKGGNVMSLVEQRSMFTMWSALPGPLILGADLRPGAACGGVDDAEVMKILTNKAVIAVNQDPLAAPMVPVRRWDGFEVWRKPLTSGFALILFNRNHTDYSGVPLTLARCDSSSVLALDLGNGSMRLQDHPSLCLGSIGISACSNPPSPRIGVVTCNDQDKTQHWQYDPNTKQINNDASHDFNAGPQCSGDEAASMLLYVTQGHQNEHWNVCSNGTISGENGQCLSLVGSLFEGTSSTIAVTWKELGLAPDQRFAIRDLWEEADFGIKSSSFSAEVSLHEARIFTFIPETVI